MLTFTNSNKEKNLSHLFRLFEKTKKIEKLEKNLKLSAKNVSRGTWNGCE